MTGTWSSERDPPSGRVFVVLSRGPTLEVRAAFAEAPHEEERDVTMNPRTVPYRLLALVPALVTFPCLPPSPGLLASEGSSR